MVLRLLYRLIINEKTIEYLSQTYPIRRAAQLVSRVIVDRKHAIEDIRDNIKDIHKQEVFDDFKRKTTDNRITRFSERLIQELKNELNDAKEEIRRRQR